MFKEGIKPAWEDAKNARGGAWIVKASNKAGGNKNAGPGAPNKTAEWLDQSWLYLLLECIGEAFGDDSEEICGVVASVRATECRLALWTRTADDADAVQRIGYAFIITRALRVLASHFLTISFLRHLITAINSKRFSTFSLHFV